MVGVAFALRPDAFAQDTPSCPQSHAIYTDADEVYTLTFKTPKDGLGVATNYFEIVAKGSGMVLNGWVVWSDNEIPLPDTNILYNCLEGDVTGTELRECTVWQGPIYAFDGNGNVDLLAPGAEPAAESLLLPAFGRALRQAQAWTKEELSAAPWDVFRLTGCSTKQE